MTRLALTHFLRWLKGINGAFDGDLMLGIVFFSVVEANVAWLSEDSGLTTAFGDIDRPPPDDLRRPVSARALAISLGLPRETVRRQVEKLVARGLCVRDSRQRLVAPTAVMAGPQMRDLSQRGYVNVVGLVTTMRRLDVLPQG